MPRDITVCPLPSHSISPNLSIAYPVIDVNGYTFIAIVSMPVSYNRQIDSCWSRLCDERQSYPAVLAAPTDIEPDPIPQTAVRTWLDDDLRKPAACQLFTVAVHRSF